MLDTEDESPVQKESGFLAGEDRGERMHRKLRKNLESEVAPQAVKRTLVVAAVILLMASIFAGCINNTAENQENPEPTTTENPEDGESPSPEKNLERNLHYDLTEEDEVEAPTWKTGGWFSFEFNHQQLGIRDEVFDAVVVEDRGDGWFLATDSRRISKEYALWQMPPFLGEVKKENLGANDTLAQWDWLYDFPIYHNKTWEVEMEYSDPFGNSFTRPLVMTANYTAAIETHEGYRPGFAIEAVSGNSVYAEYDYVPVIGWFTHFYFSSGGADDWQGKLDTRGHGSNWTGLYYVHESELLLVHSNRFPPADVEAPIATFTVAEDADSVTGFIQMVVDSGAQEVRIEPPEGEPVQASMVSPVGLDHREERWETTAVAGEWNLFAPGAGMYAYAGVQAWQIWEDRFEL